MINKVILVGNVVKKPVLHQTSNNSSVSTVTIATNETFKKEGEKVENATFHECVVWKNLATFVCDFVDKGDLVYVEGKIKRRDYIDKNGEKRYVSEIGVDTFKILHKKQPRVEE